MPAPEEISILDSPVPPPPGSRLKPSVSAVTLSTVATALTGTESGEESSTLLAPGLARLKETIARVPCRGYVSEKNPTPVEFMPRLSELCGGPELYVKRDDLLPLAGGGSKTRKLDYLVQEALDAGADVLVTCGAVQSNHCRLTASAAAREGLECYLVLEERVPGSYDPHAGGNNYVFSLLGANQTPAPLGGVGPVQDELVAKLTAEGKTPYVIPGGGSNQLGALGYARCAAELIEQSEQLKAAAGEADAPGFFWDAIVTCSGSGGTHTGLLTGLRAAGVDVPVVGISVRFDAAKQGERIRGQVKALGDVYFASFDSVAGGLDDDVVIDDTHVGEGYSIPTEEMAEAIQAFARKESIILDPVYTGKGAAGFLSLARGGEYGKGQRLLFLHTGGAPSLYHYQTLPGHV
ncbi:hypothetical protein ACHAXT_003418 [Thalassiosira profunda]